MSCIMWDLSWVVQFDQTTIISSTDTDLLKFNKSENSDTHNWKTNITICLTLCLVSDLLESQKSLPFMSDHISCLLFLPRCVNSHSSHTQCPAQPFLLSPHWAIILNIQTLLMFPNFMVLCARVHVCASLCIGNYVTSHF